MKRTGIRLQLRRWEQDKFMVLLLAAARNMPYTPDPLQSDTTIIVDILRRDYPTELEKLGIPQDHLYKYALRYLNKLHRNGEIKKQRYPIGKSNEGGSGQRVTIIHWGKHVVNEK